MELRGLKGSRGQNPNQVSLPSIPGVVCQVAIVVLVCLCAKQQKMSVCLPHFPFCVYLLNSLMISARAFCAW